ncbi:hypothetical protein J7J83_00595 [bacterium]|nr:hypothetical protein [bacterium]
MKKNGWIKIVGLCFTVSLVVGMIGGALTNEYLISYLFGQLTQKQEEDLPIVKKVIEEKVYVEESLTTDAIVKARPVVATLYSGKTLKDGINGVVLTTDGVVVSCDPKLQKQKTWNIIVGDQDVVEANVIPTNSNNGLIYLQIKNKGEFYKTIPLAKDNLKLGQKMIVLNSDSISSALLSEIGSKNMHRIDRQVGEKFDCSPVINLGGELVGIVALNSNNNQPGTTLIIPAESLEELMAKEVAL